MHWKISKIYSDDELITSSTRQFNKPPVNTNIGFAPNSLINAIATQEEVKLKKTTTGTRIYEKLEREIVDIYDTSRWRLTIDRSNDQVSEPKPIFIKRLITFISLDFR
jgi:hypothetical protein